MTTPENPDGLVSIAGLPPWCDCPKCATYQHDVSYHDDDVATPENTATPT